jgi:hypothetical protein
VLAIPGGNMGTGKLLGALIFPFKTVGETELF